MSLNRGEGIQAKRLTSSATVTTADKTGLFYGVNLQVATAASSVIIRDGGATGTQIAKIAFTGAGVGNIFRNGTESIMYKNPITCSTDIYATIAGTGAVANIFYKEIES